MTIMFNPNASDSFVTAGVKHVAFWKAAGNGLISKKGIFGKVGPIQSFLSIAFDKASTYTGATNGAIYKWSENTLQSVIEAHSGPVFDLTSTKDGFASGGKDGIIKLWGAG